VLGQAHPPLARLCGVVAAAFLVLVVPATGRPGPVESAAALRAQNVELAAKSRSALLDLYSLDARLAGARSRLASLRVELGTLRSERDTLRRELLLARAGTQISEQQLASRVRQLYDQGDVSTLEVIFSATSITDALTLLDDVHRVASLNDQVLAELRTAETRLVATSGQLAARTASLDAALRAAAADEASLNRTRAARATYMASLASRRDLNSAQITRLESQASVAEHASTRLTGSVPVAAVAVPVSPSTPPAANPLPGGRTLTVTISGYALPGKTATGIPVGWGVAAVDPGVIPLGTHLWVPGYGEAVAADVGGAIVGARVDLWFPSVGQARMWGLRTLTIALQ
jgi:3D (Asp-Asp-Asp) domain-containing protein/peptidoglycan hydrolase CwlO-like protein